jgi:hypothetical protein
VPTVIHTRLAFTRPADAAPDIARAGVLRARSLDPDALHAADAFDLRGCRVADCSAPGGLAPDIATHGFGHVDLSAVPGLAPIFERARAAGRIEEDDARALRRGLKGATLPLSRGRRLRLLFVAPEGLIMRRGGPNGLRVTASATARGQNDHDAAVSVHADQDVRGTPVKQLLRGAGPWLFRHSAPSGANRWSPIFLLNVWVPLQQVTRPLALMDVRSLDRRAHQLRYALPTDGFLERPPDQRVNDLWTFLYHPDQSWHFASDAGPERAWIFETLGTPHGAIALPGEDRAEQLYLRVEAAREAIDAGDAAALQRSGRPLEGDLSAPVTASLARAIAALEVCLSRALREGLALRGDAGWAAEAARALDGVVRKSIELRAVGLITGGWGRGG